MEQIDLLEARSERDASMEQVLGNAGDWSAKANMILPRLKGKEMTGEEIRMELSRVGIVPHHPNAWGAWINARVRAGLLKATGEYRQMKARKSHARKTPVYLVK